jgi:hypothetical protein
LAGEDSLAGQGSVKSILPREAILLEWHFSYYLMPKLDPDMKSCFEAGKPDA